MQASLPSITSMPFSLHQPASSRRSEWYMAGGRGAIRAALVTHSWEAHLFRVFDNTLQVVRRPGMLRVIQMCNELQSRL